MNISRPVAIVACVAGVSVAAGCGGGTRYRATAFQDCLLSKHRVATLERLSRSESVVRLTLMHEGPYGGVYAIFYSTRKWAAGALQVTPKKTLERFLLERRANVVLYVFPSNLSRSRWSPVVDDCLSRAA